MITGEKGGQQGAAEAWRKKEVRVNTALYYKQSKYQNAREEPEGFAKLITVLNNFGAAALSAESLSGVRMTVLSLIGYFDLDANRALDIVLDRSALPPADWGGLTTLQMGLARFCVLPHRAEKRQRRVGIV